MIIIMIESQAAARTATEQDGGLLGARVQLHAHHRRAPELNSVQGGSWSSALALACQAS